jgi:hypothetical protein
MRKVICVICGGIFKVEQAPPPELLAEAGFDAQGQIVDPYSLSALRLRGDPESVDYCQRTCAYCRRGSPWPTGFQADEPDA